MIECLFFARTEQIKRTLRRWTFGDGEHPHDKCEASGYGYHNAHSPFDVRVAVRLPNGCFPVQLGPARTDPRWPQRCACGYQFQDDDEWQVFVEWLYRHPQTGALVIESEFPLGAMWWVDHYPASFDSKLHAERGGGPHLFVKTPGGPWDIDAKSSNGDGWTRTGTPPHITAHPSILIEGRYHGWLKDGVLSPC
jgi:hypothetical protein